VKVGGLKGSQVGVRLALTAVCVLVSIVLLLPVLLFKVLEGAYLVASYTKDWTGQIWGTRRP
jgi:hypothetical protein